MLVMLLLLSLSLAMDDGKFDHRVAVEVMAARGQQQRRRWRQWTMIGGKSSRQQERQRSHDGVR
jgi:hypothetical protein